MGVMSVLSRDQQIQVVGCLTEGMSIRAIERLTGIHRDTIMRLGARVGRGCAELHDRTMVGLRVGWIEMDELWAFVGKKQRHLKRTDNPEKGDQYTFVALASSSRAIIGYRTGKRNTEATNQFIQDLRGRVIGAPEISTDGFLPYQPAIRDAFQASAHGVINKTFSVTHLVHMDQAQHRYSPAAVIAVVREAVRGEPSEISTSYVERSNLSIRMANRRFTRLTNAFSKKLDNHLSAVALYVAHCRVHESLSPNARNQATPAMALGITDRVWSLGDLIDAALAIASPNYGDTLLFSQIDSYTIFPHGPPRPHCRAGSDASSDAAWQPAAEEPVGWTKSPAAADGLARALWAILPTRRNCEAWPRGHCARTCEQRSQN
jgi:IS1 family transposase